MQTLLFNTTDKTVKVYEGQRSMTSIMYTYDNVPTVKIKEEGFYEVIQKVANDEGNESNYPAARFPISNTNMIIER
jgi:hypothetical protein